METPNGRPVGGRLRVLPRKDTKMFAGKRVAGLLCVGLMCGAILSQTDIARAIDPSFVVPSRQRQLFLDNYGIGSIDGLTRTIHQPDKVGPVMTSPNPAQTLQTRSVPAWDPVDRLYKAWTLSTDHSFHYSSDGINWIDGPIPNMRTDIVVYDGSDPDPNRRFKAVLPNTGVAVSPDGINWSMVPNVPGIPSSDEYNLSFDRQDHQFILTVKRGGPYGRAVALATSYDFEHWTDYGLIFHADALDQTQGTQAILDRFADPTMQDPEYNVPATYNVDVYNMGIFRYEGLYVGLPSMYHHTGSVPAGWPGFDEMNLSPDIRGLVDIYGDYTGFYKIQLAASRDLINWERIGNRQPFIETSPIGSGNHDLQTMIGPSAPVVRGDTLWFYYTGIKRYAFISSGNDPAYDDYYPDKGAVMLSVLRRDGFMSLDAGDQFGTLVTDPFVLSDEHLFVNLDAPTGVMYVQVLDEDGQVVATSDSITGNLPFAEVPWAQGSFADLLGEEISLRFRLFDGSLYSYAVGPLLGDANGDGLVDDLDLTALARHWQQAGGLAEGDFNDDGVVDELDLTVLATAWPGGAGALDVSAVPEPGTLAMIAAGGVALLRRRKGTRCTREQIESRVRSVPVRAF